MERTTARTVADRYSVVFLDAYGVLVNGGGIIEGAAAFLEHLEARGTPYYVLTNDASKLPSTSARRYQAGGLTVPMERILTSGGLLKGWFAQNDLEGAQCLVLGPPDSARYVERAGGRVLDLARLEPSDVEVIVVGDESGFSFLPAVDLAVTAALIRLEDERPLNLVCPNPDLIYPKHDGSVGIAAASIAGLIERAVAARRPGRDSPRFALLGKPHAPLFEEACARAGTRDAVMFGDQLSTDIRGANAAGLASALVSWGLTTMPPGDFPPHDEPTFFVDAW